MSMQKLLTQHAALGVARQHRLATRLGPHEWTFDLESGTCSFGEGRTYRAQFLASIDQDMKWRWGTAHKDMPESMRESVSKIQSFGRDADIPQLAVDEFKLDADEESGALAIVSAGLAGADGYYAGHHDGKAMVFLLFDTNMVDIEAMRAEEVMQVLNSLVVTYEVDHKVSMRRLLDKIATNIEETSDHMEATCCDGLRLSLDFDDEGRLIGMGLANK